MNRTNKSGVTAANSHPARIIKTLWAYFITLIKTWPWLNREFLLFMIGVILGYLLTLSGGYLQ
jgi:hypothetical protein